MVGMDVDNIGVLRAIDDIELDTMLKWRNSSSVRANMYTQHEITLEEHKEWWGKVKQDDSQLYFMFEEAGNALGIVGFSQIDRVNEQAFWAFYASPRAPRGTGSKMELAALNYAFDILNLHKLSCEVLAYNTAVIKLHKKFGFKEEGVFREHHIIGNKFVDIFRLGILMEEWEIKRPVMKEKIDKFYRN